jgi:glucokinase
VGGQRGAAAQRVLAVDIGGTKLAAAVVDATGRVAGFVERPTPATTDAAVLFAALQVTIAATLAAAGTPLGALEAIGVGCGGPMRYPEGCVSPLNIPAWRDFPLRERLEAAYALPTRVDNDAKALALGEYWQGAGRGARALLGMVISTGVGGGLVLDGQLVHGAQGNAGHIGHVIVRSGGPRCGCGARGCLEAIAAGPSLARAATRALRRGVPSALRGVVPLTGEAVTAAARTGDALAVGLLAEAGRAVGQALAGAAALVDLDRVVIGGGVSQAGGLLFEPLRAELARRARLAFTRGLAVVPAQLGRQAGVVGAAALWFLAAQGAR